MVVRRNLESETDIFGQASRKLLGDLRISQVQGRDTSSRSRKVLIHTMSPDRVEFSTTLRFPVNSDYRLTIALMINHQKIFITGIIESRAQTGNLQAYGLRITDRSMTRLQWIRQLNDWLLRSRPARLQYKVHYLYRK